MRPSAIILGLMVAVHITAQPIDNDSRSPSPATQSCHATDRLLWTSYSVYIGVPYIGAADCDATYRALRGYLTLTNWQCVEKNGNIQLWFNIDTADPQEYASNINRVLGSRYPSVNSFNCPAG
jgi:hypothetical protein